jgi:2-dehydropantoate 2-reductase
MKIAILGTGAMGSIYAALLADAGNDIYAIDVWQEHVDVIMQNGLTVTGASGERTVRNLHASSTLDEAGACDLYIIATKASGVADAAHQVSRVMRSDSLVLTIQNGLGSGERIAKHMSTENVLLGVAEGFGASLVAPGHAHHNAMKMIRVGEMTGGITERLQSIEKVWKSAGFDVQAFEDIEQLIWEKFLCNVTFSGPCTVFDLTLGELMNDEESWKIACGCASEVAQLAEAKGIKVSYDDPIEYVISFGKRMPDARPSMLLDHHAKRISEIDAINGMVPVVGADLGIETPYNNVISAVVRNIEKSF